MGGYCSDPERLLFDWLGYAIGRSTKLRELALRVCSGEISGPPPRKTRGGVANGYDIGNGSALQVSIIKILKFHPDFDANMAPFFTRGFKLLPHVIRWYDRASVCPKLRVGVRMDMDLRKLSTIFQFIRGLPLLYVASMSEREIEEIRRDKAELHRKRLNLSLKLRDAEGRVREVEERELRAARRL